MTDTLNADTELPVDQPLMAQGDHVKLVFQSDGNLVLYAERPGGWLARWASGTDGSDAKQCILHADGTLALHDTAGAAVWSSSPIVLPQQILVGVGGREIPRLGGRTRPKIDLIPPVLKVNRDESFGVQRGRLHLWESGTSLEGWPMKLPAGPEVWALEGGQRHWIPDPDTLEVKFGGWGNVVELTQAQIDQWPLGDQIPSVVPDITGIKACADMPVPPGLVLPPRQELAQPPRIGADGSLIGVTTGALTGIPSQFWNVGQVIRIKLMGGSAFVHNKVREFADQWMQHANIHWQWVGPGEAAEIKVSFNPGGSWSMIGRDALWAPFDVPTMNYGWFDDSTPDSEFSRVVLHEFGHALGFVHEHQSPAAGIAWDREKAYDYYLRTQGWDRGMTDAQVFNKYSVSQTNFSAFDPTSIMEYPIPASLTLDGKGTPWNSQLSATDIEYARRWYPFAPSPSNTQGLLRTGDDCDEIDFTVTYGGADTSVVSFSLRSASGITWWKGIEVPVGAAGYVMLEEQDGKTAAASIPVNAIDTARPLRFHKAKGFGIHTRLGFTWDVLKALPGGSSLSFLWKRDRC